MYKMEYDNHGALMMVKIEEVCLFTPKAVDGMIARLRSLRDKHWHDWPGERHNRNALETAIRNGGLEGLFDTGALDFGSGDEEPAQAKRKPARHKRGKLAVVAGGKVA
jgi:hypothetical protein